MVFYASEFYFSHCACFYWNIWVVRNSEIKQLRPLFFAMLWDIDLIFGMWVYKLRSGSMIFGWVMALGLWNLVKYLVVTTFFRYAWRYWLDFGIWVYNDELQIKFTFLSGPMIFGRVMALDLIFGMRVYNHKLQINIEIHSGWKIFGQLTAIGFWNLTKYLVVITFFSLWFEILTWVLVCEFKEAWGYRSWAIVCYS